MLQTFLTRRHRWALWGLTAALLFCPRTTTAQTEFDDDDLPPYTSGLVAEVRSSAGHNLTRLVPDVSLHELLPPDSLVVGSGQSAGNGNEVTWKGHLWARDNGMFRLQLFVAGQVQVSLAGKLLLDAHSDKPQWLECTPIELSFGYHPLQIEFRPTTSLAQLRLYWSGPAFALEPIGSEFLFHATDESPQDHFQMGQLLDRGLRCTACHHRGLPAFEGDLASASDNAKSSSERHLLAPALTKLQGNLRPQWLVQQLTRTASAPTPRTDASQPSDSTTQTTAADKADTNSTRAANWSSQHWPAFEMTTSDAEDIVAALWQASLPPEKLDSLEAQLQQAYKKRANKSPKLRTVGDAAQGEMTFVSIGCLACHQVGELGASSEMDRQLFGGGDVTGLRRKRPSDFIRRWLDDPASVNVDHRMPNFELTLLEQIDLATYLDSLNDSLDSSLAASLEFESSDRRAVLNTSEPEAIAGDAVHGAELITAYRCGSCHQLPQTLAAPLKSPELDTIPLSATSRWDDGCLQAAKPSEHRPGFGLNPTQRAGLQAYWSEPTPWALGTAGGEALLRENNCIACHARDNHPGIKQQLPDIVAAVPELAPRLSALAPPSLTAIGDKLYEPALRASITRTSPPLRPWLDVRMPRFTFSESQLELLTQSLIAHDRIPASDDSVEADEVPPNAPQLNETPSQDPNQAVADNDAAELTDNLLTDTVHQMAAARLVTAEGFGCQSCHAIGAVAAPKVDLNARGTNLAMLGERIRPSWFQRWVRNPSRIVPRMEMPAIQTPVHGVLQNSLEMQIDALWAVLNTPGFTPPRPGPVRVVRTHNNAELDERSWLLTNVLEIEPKIFIRPLVVGLPNRHNFLFDLETGQLSTWWLGDTAHQHTRGKTWFWEPGVGALTQPEQVLESVRVIDASGRAWQPTPRGQFAVQFDRSEHVDNSVVWHGRLHLTPVKTNPADNSESPPARWVTIAQTLAAVEFGTDAKSSCTTRLSGLEPGDRVQWHSSATAVSSPAASGGEWRSALQLGETLIDVSSQTHMQANELGLFDFVLPEVSDDAGASPTGNSSDDSTGGTVQWTSVYRALVPTDQFPTTSASELQFASQQLDVVPGFSAIQLPLPTNEMPISFAWDAAGDCYVGSLKGRVLRLRDSDSDGLADHYELISDELPTPYGLWAGDDGIDALSKFGLVRLTPPLQSGDPYDATIVADGWGSTEDYHDWAVGLERDTQGNYYMVLPCQQDDRSPAAAYLRGTALKLMPVQSSQEPRQYRIEVLSAGLRFPMGLALSRDGALFATDNQGNYNPFNELNHLQAGKRYGFINKLENRDGFSPPFESPAINLPHPWTRSVNGLCFLQTPSELSHETPLFGPFEGHLIGCEMNGRFLVRMSLQKVGEEYQGAAYLFSRPPTESSDGAPLQIGQDASGTSQKNFEGPIVCEVSPAGELYVGSLLDSGWGGGQNTGSIVRLTPSAELPLGIAEVRATARGFEVDFTQVVHAEKAADIENYQLRSYQRISTPAYGGDDQDERHETIAAAQVSKDCKRVTLELHELRAGFVYELNVAALGSDSQSLFPSQAHYTMRIVPE